MAATAPEIKKAIAATRARGRRRVQRDTLWPDAETVVYRPKEKGGWAQMPRTIPLVATLIDQLGGRSDAGRLYLTLWSYDYGDGFVEIPDPALVGLEAGYSTTRAERTFGERMRILRDLGFIRTKPLGAREFGYVLGPCAARSAATAARSARVIGGSGRGLPALSQSVSRKWWSSSVL